MLASPPNDVPLDWQGPSDRAYSIFEDHWLAAPLFRRFQYWAKQSPDSIAIQASSGTVSYQAVEQKALRWGAWLDTHLDKGEPVGIGLSIGPDYPVALLAALACGRPYVPLDLSFPPERIAHIMSHSGIKTVWVDDQTKPVVAALHVQGVVLIDWSILPENLVDWEPTATAEDHAYILYTSGSTGQPKGVYQNQKGLAHDILQYTRSIHIDPSDGLSCLYSPSVGGAQRDIFGALLNGATLALFDLKKQGFLAIAEQLQAWGVTILHTMPPILRAFLKTPMIDRYLEKIRLVYVAGDRLYAGDLAAFRTHFDTSTYFYTGIGSTECSTLYRQWFIPPTFALSEGLVPVGYPIPDRDVVVEASGEMVVYSPYLSLGYWRDEAQTALRYIPSRPGQHTRGFRTGDTGVCRPDGLMDFLGRQDRQVKLRGFRVEPGEVEAVCRTLSGVEDAAVIVRQTEEIPQLIAYVVTQKAPEHISNSLYARLPDHLCPTELIAVAHLPLLGNFKVDYRTLEAVDADRVALQKTISSRSQENPELDSLKRLELHAKIEAQLGTTLPLDGFIASEPQISKIALRVVVFSHLGGMDIEALQFIKALSTVASVIAFDYPKNAKQRAEQLDIQTLANDAIARYIDPLPPQTQLILLGYSFGTRVAYAVAQTLYGSSRTVAALILGDCPKIPQLREIRKKPPETRFKRWVLAFQQWARLKIGALFLWEYRGFHLMSDSMLLGIQGPLLLADLAKYCVFLRNCHRFTLRPYPGKTLLILTQSTQTTFPKLGEDLGWKLLCIDLTILKVPGTHYEFFQSPCREALMEWIARLGSGLFSKNLQ